MEANPLELEELIADSIRFELEQQQIAEELAAEALLGEEI